MSGEIVQCNIKDCLRISFDGDLEAVLLGGGGGMAPCWVF